jgi:hypothetical protein
MWLIDAGITPSTFNLISTPFTASGIGFDQVLNESTVNTSTGKVVITAMGTTQTSTISFNTTAETMTIASTTVSASATSQSTHTTIVPTQAAQQTALNGIAATLTNLFNATNSGGSQLTAAEITPFLSSNLLDESLNQTQYAAMLATALRGTTMPTAQILAISSLDPVNGKADVVTNLGVNPMAASAFLSAELWFENVDGTWLIGGDQHIALVGLQVANRNHQGCPYSSCGGSGGSGIAIGPTVAAPSGAVTSVTITDPSGVTGWTNAPMQSSSTEIFEFQPTPTTKLDVQLTQFDMGWVDLTEPIPAGTLFKFALTEPSKSVVDYTLPSNASTTEQIKITSPTGDTLSSYSDTWNIPWTVTWTLPTTFPIAFVYLGAETYTTPANQKNSSTIQCEISGTTNTVTAGFPTAGTITIPDSCKGEPIQFMEIEVMVEGVNGEIAQATLNVD